MNDGRAELRASRTAARAAVREQRMVGEHSGRSTSRAGRGEQSGREFGGQREGRRAEWVGVQSGSACRAGPRAERFGESGLASGSMSGAGRRVEGRRAERVSERSRSGAASGAGPRAERVRKRAEWVGVQSGSASRAGRRAESERVSEWSRSGSASEQSGSACRAGPRAERVHGEQRVSERSRSVCGSGCRCSCSVCWWSTHRIVYTAVYTQHCTDKNTVRK